MKNTILKDDQELHKAFEVILSIKTLKDYVYEICELIINNNINNDTILNILEKHEIESVESIKEELLDLLIIYLNLVVKDHEITETEKHNVKMLKLLFKIKEGDFYNYRKEEIKDTVSIQLQMLYLDLKIDSKEAEYKVELQGLFDLSYDQLEEFKESIIRESLEKGANILDLDTVKYPPVAFVNIDTFGGRDISSSVRVEVWKRDGGKCIMCGSREKIEYDHIIPFSKGGSNTARNIQLLCQKCNRKKSNNIL